MNLRPPHNVKTRIINVSHPPFIKLGTILYPNGEGAIHLWTKDGPFCLVHVTAEQREELLQALQANKEGS